MGKLPKAKVDEFNDDEFAALTTDKGKKLLFGVDNYIGTLAVFDDTAVTQTTISPKQLRKFGKALVRVADMAEKPKEQAGYAEYFASDAGSDPVYYRLRPGHDLEMCGGLEPDEWSPASGAHPDVYAAESEPLLPVDWKDLPEKVRHA